ncbi:hydrolase Cof [Bacillus sp. AFS073361]|uniref:Cof-type HAD-IIB family hydrolase n=1 Tax=Bacillus sp. AFS073361 TaxID=2033511 RepID=UPI000BF50B5C|nr:Cof-type HAD-IIB family hydrolase [Bacillus sp. AFS073361]PFP15648.1 hydrolase Cof [Bacillus sp. AFS073361]
MNEKIVFFDIDGTLLTEEKVLPESTKKAVRMLQEKGIYTAIATGRSPQMFEWILEELHIDSYVSINGQYVVFEGKEIYSNPMDLSLLNDLTSMVESNGHAIAYCHDHHITVNEENHPLVLSSYNSLKINYPPVSREFYKQTSVFQGHLFCQPQEEETYIQRFPECSFIRWHEHAIDILPKGCSKAIGIGKMLDVIGISNENCYAFGDGLNDLEMLTSVGIGIAMGNAVPEAKAAADLITTSCYEDGIFNGLKELGILV